MRERDQTALCHCKFASISRWMSFFPFVNHVTLLCGWGTRERDQTALCHCLFASISRWMPSFPFVNNVTLLCGWEMRERGQTAFCHCKLSSISRWMPSFPFPYHSTLLFLKTITNFICNISKHSQLLFHIFKINNLYWCYLKTCILIAKLMMKHYMTTSKNHKLMVTKMVLIIKDH